MSAAEGEALRDLLDAAAVIGARRSSAAPLPAIGRLTDEVERLIEAAGAWVDAGSPRLDRMHELMLEAIRRERDEVRISRDAALIAERHLRAELAMRRRELARPSELGHIDTALHELAVERGAFVRLPPADGPIWLVTLTTIDGTSRDGTGTTATLALLHAVEALVSTREQRAEREAGEALLTSKAGA